MTLSREIVGKIHSLSEIYLKYLHQIKLLISSSIYVVKILVCVTFLFPKYPDVNITQMTAESVYKYYLYEWVLVRTYILYELQLEVHCLTGDRSSIKTCPSTDEAQCAATQRIVDKIDWECDVIRNYAEENLVCPATYAVHHWSGLWRK